MIPPSTARIAGSVLCSWGYSPDPGNHACDNVALPGFDLCPAHERLARYLEEVAAQNPDWEDDEERGQQVDTAAWGDFEADPNQWGVMEEYEFGQWEPKAVRP